MDLSISVRPATLDDLSDLQAFASAMAWETEGKRLDPDTLRRGLQRVFAQPELAEYWVAVRNEAVVGTLMLTYEWSDWRCGLWWWIQSVYVPPEARRSGVFRALYRHAEARARETPGVCGLRLYVETQNLRAQATYRQLGMRDAHYQVMEAAFD
ncbi:MAG: GNAT family N-acetyltransferase [Xanthomonadales bacterium]|nr:GNAT family N-acetyltransferase [Xanthomonadales bacterium]